MYKTLKRFVLLLALVCALCCFAVACDEGQNPDGPAPDSQTVTYTVTVTSDSDGIDFTTLKAQWLSGTETAGETAIGADGKASLQLASAPYSVTLVGVPQGYSFTPATVTAAKPDATIAITQDKTDYTVTVTVPEGITLSSDVKAQLYSGETAVGSPVALTDLAATISAATGNYTVKLVGLPDYLTASAANLSPTSASAQIAVTFAEVTYTVTVTADDGLTLPQGVTVALYSGDDKVGDDVALSDGSATITATAGNYTAKLGGLSAAYSATTAELTLTDRTGEISVSVNTITLTLDIPANVTIADKTLITANLKDSEGTEVLETPVAFNADGVAKLIAPQGVYTVVLNGLPEHVSASCGQIRAIDNSATVYVAEVASGGSAHVGEYGDVEGVPYSISNEGRYLLKAYVPEGPFDNETHISFTSHDEDALWSFAFNVSVMLGYYDADDYNNNPLVEEDQELQYIVTANSTVKFIVNTEATEFLLTVTKLPMPQLGTEANPATVQIGENSVDLSKAYYNFPYGEDGYSYTLTYGAGLTVSARLWNDTLLQWDENVNIASGEPFSLSPYLVCTMVITAEEGTEIKFTFARVAAPGTEGNPIEIELDSDVEFNITSSGTGHIWYQITIEEANKYLLSFTGDMPGLYVCSQASDDSAYNNHIGEVVYSDTSEADRVFDLTAGTYYIGLTKSWGSSGTFKFSVYVPHETETKPGDKEMPIEAVDGDNKISQDRTDMVYYKYTAKKSGNFIFSFNNVGDYSVNLRAQFYKDATYETGYSSSWDYFSNSEAFWLGGDTNDTFVYIEKDTTIYFGVQCNIYNPGLEVDTDFYISVIDVAATTAADGENSLAGAGADMKTAYYSYTPAKTGAFALSVSSEVTSHIKYFNADNKAINNTPKMAAEGSAINFAITYSCSAENAANAKFTISVLEATEIVSATTTVGTAESAQKSAFYKYKIPATGLYTITEASTNNAAQISISCYDSEFAEMYNFRTGAFLAKDSTIYIKLDYSLYSPSSSTVTVTLTIMASEPEELSEGANTFGPISVNENNYNKFLSFTAKAAGTVHVTITYSVDPMWKGTPSYYRADGTRITETAIAVQAGETIYITGDLSATYFDDTEEYNAIVTITFTAAA